MAEKHDEGEGFHVLPDKLGGGPMGLGDPDDRNLRSVEKNILISQKMRKRAREIDCKEFADKFASCAKEQGLLMPFRCRKENKALQECIIQHFSSESYRQTCTEEYLAERAYYRRTGIKQKQIRKDSPTYNK